jgi:resuscitation-promoting factor RpfB
MRKKFKLIRHRATMAHRKRVRTIKRISKKPLFTVPLATFMVLLLLVMVGFLVSSHGNPAKLQPSNSTVVVVNYDKHERTVPTSAKTVGDLLQRLNIKLNEGDVVEPSRSTEIAGDNFRVNVYRAVPVTVVDGDQKTFTYSAASTPRSIVRQVGINVYPEDRLELLPTDNFLTESSIGERVVIDRATPISLNLYGTPVTIRTHAKTVGDLLKEKNIALAKDDSVQPAANTPLTANAQVFVLRKGTQVQTAQEDIPMPVQTVDDDSLSFGVTAVRQQGSPGKKLITYQVQLQNGVEIGRTKIQEVVSVEPVTQVVARGTHFDIASDKTALMAAAGIGKSDYTYADYIISRESKWNYTARNSSSGAYGLCQALPGSKMASAGGDWQSNPVTQLKWCDGYAKRTYGGWAGAYSHWLSAHNW